MSDESKALYGEVLDPDEAALPRVVERNKRRTRTAFLPKLLKVAGRIPFADDLAAAWYAASDPRTPTKVRGVLLAACAYFVVPTDLLPDIIAGFGFTDDATVLATALGLVSGHVKPRHERAARRLLSIPEPPVEPTSGAATDRAAEANDAAGAKGA